MSHHMRFVIGLSLLMFVPVLWHFATVFGYLGEAPTTRLSFMLRIGAIAVIFGVLSAVVASAIAARHGDDSVLPDEREHLIEVKAERNGGYAVSIGLLALMWFAFWPMAPMDVANAALAILAFGEAVKIVSGLIYLRRGV